MFKHRVVAVELTHYTPGAPAAQEFAVDWYRQTRALKIDRARRELGYSLRISIDEGLRRAYEWYRAEGMI